MRAVRGARARRARSQRRVARRRRGVPRDDGLRLPQPVPDRRPEHRARPQLDDLHDRVADRLRPERTPDDARAEAARSSTCAPTRRRATTSSSTRGSRTRCGRAGCTSWYLTRSGKNTTLWPGFTFEFRLRTRRFDPDDYELAHQNEAGSEHQTSAPVPVARSSAAN